MSEIKITLKHQCYLCKLYFKTALQTKGGIIVCKQCIELAKVITKAMNNDIQTN